ncbi:hypothetical protein [Mesorhizobium sp. ZC-5]|jgi:hypothetical protein|uniref:hypothetical protein n=1 Tax=Mesorhizobium sp. ZC-5 TaxID=2986066 RepID=UPI0021E8D73E|nr:hypothetical protein [Mesorhizobium sp. ZC-5]MCV3238558.1 hypothetical protein [Mesorhizobium sp. ZC-5]
MLWKLDPTWLMMAVASVTVMGFFFGSIMDAIMADDGFGPFGNMILITVGFFASIFVANVHGISMGNLTFAMGTGLSGAFLTLAALALVKAGLARM